MECGESCRLVAPNEGGSDFDEAIIARRPEQPVNVGSLNVLFTKRQQLIED